MKRALCTVILLLMVISGCSARREPEPRVVADYVGQEMETPVILTEPVPIAKQMEGQTGIIRVVVTDTAFEPDVIPAGVGQPVKIHLVNKGTRVHTLSIPRWSIFSRDLAPGEENYIEFTPNEKGVWPFFSDTPGAPEPGLDGDLKVE